MLSVKRLSYNFFAACMKENVKLKEQEARERTSTFFFKKSRSLRIFKPQLLHGIPLALQKHTLAFLNLIMSVKEKD